MTCEDVRETLMEIAVDEIGTLESHLESCPECRALAERIAGNDATLGRAVDAFAQREGFDAAFQRALGLADRPEAPPARRSPWAWAAAAGFGVTVAAAAGLVLFLQSLPTSIGLPGEDVAVVAPGTEPEPTASALPPDPRTAALEEARRAKDRAREAVEEAERIANERELTADGHDLTYLETAAILGRLAEEDVRALDARVEDPALSQSERDKTSRLLMVNAFAAGDTVQWERLIERHLTTISSTDPDLAYKYALHLSKKGVAAAEEVIHWSEVALEHRTKWTGNTYVARVYGLYKIRAAAAQKLWQAAEDTHSAAPTQATSDAAHAARNRTKRFAREWFEFARVTDKDTSVAQALCKSAAGDPEYCQ